MKGFLIVDDETAMFQLYKGIIRKEFEAVVFTAENSEEAEDMIDKISPAIDVIISDINRPGKSGLDFARDIHRKYPKIKIFLVSGNLADGRKEKAEKLIKAGVIKGLLQKPFEVSNFRSMVKSFTK
ncbi:MAG: response regulator [Elusimicrobia bacterium]|nr:response regulator [Candidatus Liberimonas magnetica]